MNDRNANSTQLNAAVQTTESAADTENTIKGYSRCLNQISRFLGTQIHSWRDRSQRQFKELIQQLATRYYVLLNANLFKVIHLMWNTKRF